VSSSVDDGSRSRGLFVSASGTASGKTMVSRSVVHAFVRRGLRVAGVKPFETGCTPYPLDALALASASGDEGLAYRPAWYRAEPALAPYAVELTTGFAAPNLDAIAAEVRRLEAAYDRLVVEGAGGVLVPIDRDRSMADVMALLGYPVLLVAEDRLGVLSYVLTAYECLQRRGQRVTAIALNQVSEPDPSDASVVSNRTILADRVHCPVISFPFVHEHQPGTLADAAETSGLIGALTAEHLSSSANR
jgi:dethiobiotin synthetase